MNPLLRGSAAHVFVESLAAPQLTAADEHHLRRVLRIRASDPITLCDGAGSWMVARLDGTGVAAESETFTEPPPHRAAVLSAIPKGDRLEWMVQKLTEVGATTIGFLDCSRSVVRWDTERAGRQLDRLRRVAREAAMQSRRLFLPEVAGVVAYADAAAVPSAAAADPAGEPRLGAGVDTVLIGPEGGLTAEELALSRRHVALADNVLRVETAAVVAAVLMLTLRNECA